MTFPTMTHTWKFSSVGLTNVIPLPEGGGPYTVGMDKASGTYTGQLFWSPNLDASPLDDSWNSLTELNTTDEVAVVFDNDQIRAIMGSITVRPTPALSGGIFTPIAKCEISVVPANRLGAQNRQRHASGYGSNLIGGAAPVQDEYKALCLADGAAMFFDCQDTVLSPLTDVGPDGVTDFIDASGPTLEAGPWENSRSRGTGASAMSYTSIAAGGNLNFDASEEETIECWVKHTSFPGVPTYYMILQTGGPSITLGANASNGAFFFRGASDSADDISDPGAWLASTAYVVGDRVRAASDNTRMTECTIAGTSSTCEPTWPTDGTTVVDGGTLTWVDCGVRLTFHDWIHSSQQANDGRTKELVGSTPVLNRWYHVVGVRRSTAWELWVDGVKEAEHVIANLPGNAGTPARLNPTVRFQGTTLIAGNSSGGSEGFIGDIAYIANYRSALTPAQLLAHYDKGVELGL